MREAFRDLRAFKGPVWLDDDDGVLTCDGCGARVDCRHLRAQGWIALPDGAGNHLPLCSACSRREIGRYATFLSNGRGAWMQVWQWAPVVVVLVAVAFWGDLVTDRFVVSNEVSALIVGALVGALALAVMKLWHTGHLLYISRRIVAWRGRRSAASGQLAGSAVAEFPES